MAAASTTGAALPVLSPGMQRLIDAAKARQAALAAQKQNGASQPPATPVRGSCGETRALNTGGVNSKPGQVGTVPNSVVSTTGSQLQKIPVQLPTTAQQPLPGLQSGKFYFATV